LGFTRYIKHITITDLPRQNILVGLSKFTRDKKVKYSDDNSYKIESKDYNDALFYKEVKVKPNTPYRVKCMIKTENVERAVEKSNSGAQIGIKGSVETSESIIGTSEWSELEFMFNSKGRETVEIGFRLGGNKGDVKGTAWFSDFILEEGYREESNDWNMACFIFKNINVEVNDGGETKNLKLSMSQNDVYNMKDIIERFENSCRALSNSQMTAKCDIYEIDEPISNISYSEEFGYYIDPVDVKDQLESYLENKNYAHIFVVVRLGDLDKNIEIPIYDWIRTSEEWTYMIQDFQI
jgi:hypothetical protein